MEKFEDKKKDFQQKEENPFAKVGDESKASGQPENASTIQPASILESPAEQTVSPDANAEAASVMKYYADPPTAQTAGKQNIGSQGKSDYPKVLELGSEKVRVNSAQEESQASEIIAELKDQYGIEVSSEIGIAAIKSVYDEVPKEVTDKLRTKCWEMKELIALKKAAARFAPLLGKNRQNSTRKDAPQEVSSISKIDQGIDKNRPIGKLDHSTNGEYFEESKNFSMFSAGTRIVEDFSIDPNKNEKDIEGLAIHEFAHGLLAYKLEDFIKISGYWKNTYQVGSLIEMPMTDYGKRSAKEDLSETAKYYFLEPKTLDGERPKRFKFMKEVVDSWKPQGQAGAK